MALSVRFPPRHQPPRTFATIVVIHPAPSATVPAIHHHMTRPTQIGHPLFRSKRRKQPACLFAPGLVGCRIAASDMSGRVQHITSHSRPPVGTSKSSPSAEKERRAIFPRVYRQRGSSSLPCVIFVRDNFPASFSHATSSPSWLARSRPDGSIPLSSTDSPALQAGLTHRAPALFQRRLGVGKLRQLFSSHVTFSLGAIVR